PGSFANASVLLGLRDANGNLNVPFFADDALGLKTGVATALVGAIALVLDNTGSLLQSIVGPAACFSGNNVSLALSQMILNLFTKYLGAPLEGLTIPNAQQMHFNCPVALPSAAQAAAAWLG